LDAPPFTKESTYNLLNQLSVPPA